MSRFFAILSLFSALCCCARDCAGVAIDISPHVVGVFDVVGNPLPVPGGTTSLPPAVRVFHVDLLLSVADLSIEDAGFGNAAFHVGLSGPLSRGMPPFPTGYAPINAPVDHDGNPFTDPVAWFADNGDFGTANDLRDIIVGLDPQSLVPLDARLSTGRGAAMPIGRFFVVFDGRPAGAEATLSVDLLGASTLRGGRLVLAREATLTSTPLRFASVPEPAALLLGVVGAVFAAACRGAAAARRSKARR